MSLSQALKLANVELAGLSGKCKVQRLGQIVRLFASEVAGTVALAPFALKAQTLYNRLPPPATQSPVNKNGSSPAASPVAASSAPAQQQQQEEGGDDVYLVKQIYYGSRPRNTVDLYLPGDVHQGAGNNTRAAPVVVFVHGGAWRWGCACSS